MNEDPKKKFEDLSFKELRELDNADSKDAQINERKKANNGVEIFPYDEETLKTFNFKELNFKDMTNAQKNTLYVILITLGLLFVLLLVPFLRKIFDRTNIANIRLIPMEKEEKIEEDAFAYAGDYVIIGNNTTITVEKIKFYNFTKGNNYRSLFNYLATEDIKNISSKNIYFEYYNYSKTLLKRFKFEVDGNSLSKDDKGMIENQLSENTFNKAHYIRIRVVSESEIIAVPDPEDNPSNSSNPDRNNPGRSIDPGNSGENPGGEENPGSGNDNSNGNNGNGNNMIIEKENYVTCKKVTVDKDVRINQNMDVEFKDDKFSSYSVTYKISEISATSKNYAKDYKKMMKLYKDLIKSGVKVNIVETLGMATIEYEVVLDDFYNFTYYENSKYNISKEEYLKKIEDDRPYKLEIEIGSSKEDVKKSLSEDDWVCD